MASLPTFSVIGGEDNLLSVTNYHHIHQLGNVVNYLPKRPLPDAKTRSAQFVLPRTVPKSDLVMPKIVPDSARTVPQHEGPDVLDDDAAAADADEGFVEGRDDTLEIDPTALECEDDNANPPPLV